MKAYLDNAIVSAIGKDDTAAESTSLRVLLDAWELDKVELVTSEITLSEIKRYFLGPRREAVEGVFNRLGKVPVVRWDELTGIRSYGDQYTWINSPMIENDTLYNALLKLGIKLIDAQHLFVAAKTACAIFLTCDGGLLHRQKGIAGLCGIGVQKPSQFVMSQGWYTLSKGSE